jgi:hypothetical protein
MQTRPPSNTSPTGPVASLWRARVGRRLPEPRTVGGPVRIRPAEAVWLAGTATAMAIAWASLLAAHLGVLSAGTVPLLAAVLAAPLVVIVVRGRRRIVLDGPRIEVAVLAAVAALLAMLYLPGYPYGVADKDPGVYMAHGFAIAASGSIAQHDEVLARLPSVAMTDEATRFPGIYVYDAGRAEVVPQFYHLWPAALGFAGRAVGQTAMVNLNPLLAVVAVTGVYLVGRRLAGPVAGVAATAVLGVNMIQVWQAKYPTTEISTQLWLVLAMLAVMIAIEERWVVTAALGGAAVGVAWLDRADGLLVVLMALGVLAATFALGRFGRRHAAFAVGLGLVLPHAVWQALVPAARYSRVAAGVTPSRLALVFLVLVVGAVGGRLVWRGGLGRRVERAAVALVADPGRQLRLKALLPAGLVLLALAAWFRPQLFGPDWFTYGDRVIRSYDELNLRRLAWFVTVPGVLAALTGFAVLAIRLWRASAWAVLGPAVAALVLYVYVAENSPRLMWWSRRYVPIGLVALALLVGLAVAAAVAWRGRMRVLVGAVGIAVVGLMVVTGLTQSLPLARHREWDGSFAATARIAARAAPTVPGTNRPSQGVVAVVQTSPPNLSILFGVPLWFQRGQLSVLLPSEPDEADLAAVRRAFPNRPLVVVGDSRRGLPPGLRSAGLRRVDTFTARMPFWEQATVRRPDQATAITANVGIWRAPNASDAPAAP